MELERFGAKLLEFSSISEPDYLELECFGAKLLEFLSVSEPNCSELECFGAKLLGIRIKYIYIYNIIYEVQSSRGVRDLPYVPVAPVV